MPIRHPIEIATFRATSTTTTVTLDNLSQDYDELLIKVSVRAGNAVTNNDCFLSFSGQSGTDHTQPTRLSGNGSAAAREAFASGASGVRLCQMPGASSTTNNFASASVRVPNYKSTGVKPFFTEGGYSTTGQTSYTDTSNAFYASASPITSVRFDAGSAGGFATGSTFTVYGIYKVQSEATPKATGGQVYTDADYFYHVFKTSGTFVPNQSITSDILVIAGGGGGGGGGGRGGGGGAGGLLAHSSQSLTAQTYSVIVGAGGVNGISTTRNATNGSNSQFASLTASVGGGYGGHSGTSTNAVGGAGGSGGGGYAEVTVRSGGASTSGQGNNGGSSGSSYGAGGGGGAGAVGGTGSVNDAGAGGIGSSSYSAWGLATSTGQNSSGTYYYAGGGSGGFTGTSAVAGLGGGGLGASGNGNAATANTGGGGGGGNNGGAGGSGIVIVRYAR